MFVERWPVEKKRKEIDKSLAFCFNYFFLSFHSSWRAFRQHRGFRIYDEWHDLAINVNNPFHNRK